MATNAQITQMVTDALALSLTPAQIVLLCDRATADLLTRGHASYTVAGKQITFADLEQVRAVRDYYREQDRAASSPIATTVAEL